MNIINKQSHDFSRAIWNKEALVIFFQRPQIDLLVPIYSKLHSKSSDYLLSLFLLLVPVPSSFKANLYNRLN